MNEQLTSREREIAKLVSQGHTEESIARQLGISEGTVGRHKGNIYAKLKVNSATQMTFKLYDLKEKAS